MKILSMLALFALSIVSAHAGPQQEKMKSCNADAKTQGISGEARKAFMKKCLSTAGLPNVSEEEFEKTVKPADAKERMKYCNENAKGKKGDERKAFMSQCLKKD